MPSLPNERPELLMPVSEESAALQFFIEALKQNTAILERVGKSMEGLQAEAKETLRLVHDTRERVIKIESGGQAEIIAEVKREVATVKADVAALKENRHRQEGAASLATWFFRNWPGLIGFIALLLILLQTTGRLEP